MRAFETEKTDVAEVDRSIYDIKDKPNAAFEVNSGLTPEIVEKISEEKNDPEWMRIFRQKSLRIYNSMPVQNWGPSIEGLDMSNIVTYVRPKTEMRGKWSEVPDDIKNTFERLGIPKAERASLAGVPSMTPKWSTTTSRPRWPHRAWFTPILRAPSTAPMPKWCVPTL